MSLTKNYKHCNHRIFAALTSSDVRRLAANRGRAGVLKTVIELESSARRVKCCRRQSVRLSRVYELLETGKQNKLQIYWRHET